MPFASTEARRNWSRDYYQRNRQQVLDTKKRWREKNKLKRSAHIAVGNAIRKW